MRSLQAILLLPLCACVHYGLNSKVKFRESQGVRVSLHSVDSGDRPVIELEISNTSQHRLTVDRNGIRIRTADGRLERVPGVGQALYVIEPGQTHDVNVRFDVTDVGVGDVVLLDLRNGLSLEGKPVGIEPFPFKMVKEE